MHIIRQLANCIVVLIRTHSVDPLSMFTWSHCFPFQYTTSQPGILKQRTAVRNPDREDVSCGPWQLPNLMQNPTWSTSILLTNFIVYIVDICGYVTFPKYVPVVAAAWNSRLVSICDVLKTKLNEVGTVNFWAKFVPDSQYPAYKKIAFSVLTMFGLTYSCESAFFHHERH